MSSSARTARSADSGGKGGGKGPELKRRRLLDAGGPIEDDETARQKMRDVFVYKRGVNSNPFERVGFDPDNVADVKSTDPFDADTLDGNAVTPMDYFTEKGDLPMMRWLYVNGADTRSVDLPIDFPMYRAASHGLLDLCKWLFQHGASGDVKRRTGAASGGFTPLSISFRDSRKQNVSRWLILNGALCKDDDTGDLDIDLMKTDLNRSMMNPEFQRYELLKWAREHRQSRSSFGVFLMGTLSAVTYSATKLRNAFLARIRSEQVVDRLLRDIPPDEYHLLWDGLFPRRDCPLAVFAGKSGTLELIGDYVGIMRGREGRIVRQLTELLPVVNAQLYDEQDARVARMLGSDTS